MRMAFDVWIIWVCGDYRASLCRAAAFCQAFDRAFLGLAYHAARVFELTFSCAELAQQSVRAACLSHAEHEDIL